MKRKLTIKPVKEAGDHCTGRLSNTSVAEINKVLGFTPNVEDDPDKVKHSWGFTVDGVRCGIWDYKGSERCGSFSTFGPAHIFVALFGDKLRNDLA